MKPAIDFFIADVLDLIVADMLDLIVADNANRAALTRAPLNPARTLGGKACTLSLIHI